MNPEYTARKEVESIIDTETMASTYKLALCKGAIEISYHHAEKAFLSSDSTRIIYPLSYITAYFIRSYYPIFAADSFIPQLKTESHRNTSTRQSAFRKDFDPVIAFYSDHGGFDRLWDDMQTGTIPSQIRSEWNQLCDKISKTIVSQPMKYFGKIDSHRAYSVFQPVPTYLPDDYFEDFPGCSVNNDFFSYPRKYHEIFQDPSCSEFLIDKIHQRWCTFTMPLVDENAGISYDRLMDILTASTFCETVSEPEPVRPEGSAQVSPDCAPVIIHSLSSGGLCPADGDVLSYSPKEVMDVLHSTIHESYAGLAAAKSEWDEAEDELARIDAEIENAKLSVQKLMNQYGIISGPVSAVVATMEAQKSDAKTRLNYDEQKTRQRRNRLNRQIEILEYEKKELEVLSDSISYEDEEISTLKADLLPLYEEYEMLERHLSGRPPAFGYVGKPIKRFLTHCDAIASEFLLQSIHLYLAKTDPYSNTNTALPEWFVSAFEDWWKEKTATLQRERRAGGMSAHNPVLLFDPGHRELTLMIPAQHIRSKRPLEDVDIIVHTSSEIIYEETWPLYHEDRGYATDDVLLPVTVPSDVYHVEMVTKDSSQRFPPIVIFSPQREYACFDYETGRMLPATRNTLEKSAYVICKSPVSITPESAITESGLWYGPWQGYSYYCIDPKYSDSGFVSIGPAEGASSSDNQVHPYVALDNYHIQEHIQVNGKTTFTGIPPVMLLSLFAPDEISDYRLSIHPLSPGTLTETRLFSYDDFKDHSALIMGGTICRFDLSSDHYLGGHPVGTYAVRIRNQKRRFDYIFEFTIIPKLSVSFSNQLYLPKKGSESVVLTLAGPSTFQCVADEPFDAEIENNAWILSGPVMQEVHGTMKFAIPGGAEFSGTFSVPVPHLSWRFENPEKEIICPIRRSAARVSDDVYDELGDGKELSVFLPEEYSGTGTITITPGKSYIIKEIKKGKAIFSLSRFNDFIRETHARKYSFDLSFESRNGRFETRLFDLDVWKVTGFTCDAAADDEQRTITFSWKEDGDTPGRRLIIWKAGLKEGTPIKKAELDIPAGATRLSVSDARSNVSPGVYYAQFIRVRDEWSSAPVHFPGENTPNFFQFSIELAGEDLLKEGDELLAAGEYVDGIERYKELEQLNTQLDGLWKQKIQNTFMYTCRYDEVLQLFCELMKNTRFLKSTDYSYITFRVFECLKKPEKMTHDTFIRLFVVVELLLDVHDETARTIISSKVHDFEKAMKGCPALDEDQVAHVRKMAHWVQYTVS